MIIDYKGYDGWEYFIMLANALANNFRNLLFLLGNLLIFVAFFKEKVDQNSIFTFI